MLSLHSGVTALGFKVTKLLSSRNLGVYVNDYLDQFLQIHHTHYKLACITVYIHLFFNMYTK